MPERHRERLVAENQLHSVREINGWDGKCKRKPELLLEDRGVVV